MKKGGFFSKWDHDELFSQAFVTASDLLAKNYDPEKGTIITYLKAFLWPRVAYAYGKYHGWRYRESKWVVLESELTESGHPSFEVQEKAELPPDLTEREIDVILMRVGGLSYQLIAEKLGYKSANTVTYWINNHILPKFIRAGLLDPE